MNFEYTQDVTKQVQIWQTPEFAKITVSGYILGSNSEISNM